MSADNLEIAATGEGVERAVQVLSLNPFGELGGCRREGDQLIFLKYHFKKDVGTFAFKLTAEECRPFIEKWLADSTVKFGPEPDIDGSLKKGWRMTASNMEDHVTFSPEWMIYHK